MDITVIFHASSVVEPLTELKDAAKGLLDHYEKLLNEPAPKKPSTGAAAKSAEGERAPACHPLAAGAVMSALCVLLFSLFLISRLLFFLVFFFFFCFISLLRAILTASNKRTSVSAFTGSAVKKRRVESEPSSKPSSSTKPKPAGTAVASSASKPSSSTKPTSANTATSSSTKPAVAIAPSAASKASTDQSWFKKPQAALPTIKKKAPPASTTAPKPTVDPFALAMQQMSQKPVVARKESASDVGASGPTVLGKRGIEEVEEEGGKKPKKRVVWKDMVVVDGKVGELEAIREFSQAEHEKIHVRLQPGFLFSLFYLFLFILSKFMFSLSLLLRVTHIINPSWYA